MNPRAVRRAVALGLALFYCLLRSLLARLSGPDTLERRAQWNHESGVFVMDFLGVGFKVTGKSPERGLIVANHLSYLDVLVFGAALPCYLVSKAEISRWPFFGILARAGGTLFVDRSSRVSAETVQEQIAERLKGPVPVLFFPEGTSSDGTQLLRFHSRFYTPAVDAGIPVTSAAIRYLPGDNSPESELCWYGNAPFLPHIWKTLGAPNFCCELTFGEPRIYANRRTAADETYTEIEAMRAGQVLTHQ
jgi:1-acyl-sn-glycerol-3-phosphate acyltransferase